MKSWKKIHAIETGGRVEQILAVCDEELLGKEIDFFKISEHFFGGTLEETRSVFSDMKNITSVNIVGKNSTDEALKTGLISQSGIKLIQGIPQAQVYFV